MYIFVESFSGNWWDIAIHVLGMGIVLSILIYLLFVELKAVLDVTFKKLVLILVPLCFVFTFARIGFYTGYSDFPFFRFNVGTLYYIGNEADKGAVSYEEVAHFYRRELKDVYIDGEDVILSREQVEALEKAPHVNRKKAQIEADKTRDIILNPIYNH